MFVTGEFLYSQYRNKEENTEGTEDLFLYRRIFVKSVLVRTIFDCIYFRYFSFLPLLFSLLPVRLSSLSVVVVVITVACCLPLFVFNGCPSQMPAVSALFPFYYNALNHPFTNPQANSFFSRNNGQKNDICRRAIVSITFSHNPFFFSSRR